MTPTAALLALSFALGAPAAGPPPSPSELPSPVFGKVPLVWPAGPPSGVVLLLEGDGGWEPRMRELAAALAADGSLVLGVDTARYLSGARRRRCVYAAGDLEVLSQSAQKALHLPAYVHPVVVGYSSGATLAYAALAQAPAGTFAGGVGIGFCDDLATPVRLCAGEGLRSERRGRDRQVVSPGPVRARWKLYAGTRDRSCRLDAARAFAARVPGSEVVPVEGAGHDYSSARGWIAGVRSDVVAMSQAARRPPAAPPEASPVSDLPVVEVAPVIQGNMLAILVTGDGGWASIDRALADRLAGAGVGVVGLDSLRYFWSRKTPEQLGADLHRLVVHYCATWRRDRVLLLGYSRGADVLPVGVAHLGADVLDRVRLVALLGPSLDAELEIHVADLFQGGPKGTPILGDARAIPTALLCVYGSEESAESVCPLLAGRPATRVVALPGGHHFDGDYDAVANLLLDATR
ncbi:MAG TPA: AcvB/VirJ family lysyl-phosphatidylglycerol hydrolase [Anaeromyxobacteraceae bacterium]|nr:AcvB/VirJ family lysyl-phosphatidylglycerol hydrolase [Anaeromyxobacteraceae bacterium]